MAVRVLHYYKVRPEFMPEGLRYLGVYVRPGELAFVADPDQWELVGPTFHPNKLHAAEVQRQGYCLRELPVLRWRPEKYREPPKCPFAP